MPIHRLEELTWQEFDLLPRDVTAVFLPVSPIEEHGPHLPLGVDGLTAQAMASSAAREFAARDSRRHAVLCPLLPIGCWTYRFVGSIRTRQRAVRDVVADFGESLASQGFRHIVVTSGHAGAGHVVALEEACDAVTSRHRARRVQMVSPVGPISCRLFDGGYAADLCREVPSGLDEEEALALRKDIHAGLLETSLLLHLAPELVRDGYRTLPPVVMPEGEMPLSAENHATKGLGYLGHPSRARAEIGEAALRLASREIASLLEKMVAGEDVAALVHSPLGKIPHLKTTFWPTVAAVTAAAALLAVLTLR